MLKINRMSPLPLYYYLSFLFYLLSSSLNVAATAAANPFTPKAYAIRYWKTQISNDLPKPWFLLNKASPLTVVEFTTFSELAANDQTALTNQLQSFCSKADLLCSEKDDDVWSTKVRDAFNIGYSRSFDKATANKLGLVPGLFFRERSLKTGTIISMPSIKDKLPKRSFLPQVISSKLPFSMSKIAEMKKIFHAGEKSSMATMLAETVRECERAPGVDEVKRCVGPWRI